MYKPIDRQKSVNRIFMCFPFLFFNVVWLFSLYVFSIHHTIHMRTGLLQTEMKAKQEQTEMILERKKKRNENE